MSICEVFVPPQCMFLPEWMTEEHYYAVKLHLNVVDRPDTQQLQRGFPA